MINQTNIQRKKICKKKIKLMAMRNAISPNLRQRVDLKPDIQRFFNKRSKRSVISDLKQRIFSPNSHIKTPDKLIPDSHTISRHAKMSIISNKPITQIQMKHNAMAEVMNFKINEALMSRFKGLKARKLLQDKLSKGINLSNMRLADQTTCDETVSYNISF